MNRLEGNFAKKEEKGGIVGDYLKTKGKNIASFMTKPITGSEVRKANNQKFMLNHQEGRKKVHSVVGGTLGAGTGTAVGAGTGAVVGGALGGIAGTALGPLGTAAGATIGAGLGATAGSVAGLLAGAKAGSGLGKLNSNIKTAKAKAAKEQWKKK
jgi:hypothetical protein